MTFFTLGKREQMEENATQIATSEKPPCTPCHKTNTNTTANMYKTKNANTKKRNCQPPFANTVALQHFIKDVSLFIQNVHST